MQHTPVPPAFIIRLGSTRINVASHLGLPPGERHGVEAQAVVDLLAVKARVDGQAKLDEYATSIEDDARDWGPSWTSGELCAAARLLRQGNIYDAVALLRTLWGSYVADDIAKLYRETDGIDCRVCKSPEAAPNVTIVLGDVAECACCGQPFLLDEVRS